MKYYKVLNKKEKHHGIQYKKGLNKDILPFNDNPDCFCCGGGIYFTDAKHLIDYLEYGPYIREVVIPDDAKVIKDPDGNKWRADKIILGRRRRWSGNKNIWNEMFEYVNLPEDDQEKFNIYCEFGQLDLIKEIIDRVDPADDDNFAIQIASENGHTGVVKFLASLDCVDPSDEDNLAIQQAANNGHTDTVKFLASLDCVDPSDEDNYAIRYAAKNGHTDIVKFLASLDCVNPTYDDNFAIQFAAKNGYTDIVKFLASLDCVDSSDENNLAIRWAAEEGNLDIVEFLLSLKCVKDKLTEGQIKKYEEMTNF